MLYVISRHIQAREKKMENVPPGVHFGHLVTGATVGVICTLHYGLPTVCRENTVPNLKSGLYFFISLIF